MVDIITRLNPYFYPAYEFAGIMIPITCNNPEAARVILERDLHIWVLRNGISDFTLVCFTIIIMEKKRLLLII